ncbi:MAG: hypothetical protein H6650_15710 [Ardenticatenales bacterium]|nr:hypothetical protein [Ardenticatenales bacterium]
MLEIDQSIKMEQTAQSTVLAMADELYRSILIPANVKREAFAYLKSVGKTHDLACYQLFAAGLFILLRPHLSWISKEGTYIKVDVEYTGQDAKIKGMVLRFIYRHGYQLAKHQLYFAQIGKSSMAHQVAWQVQRGQREVDQIIDWGEIRGVLEK